MSVNNRQPKLSIRFFNDKEVRAAWDYDGNRWLFSVVDVIAALTDSKNPRNYWKVMKYRLANRGNELVTRCNQLKLIAADGKRYLTDCLPQNELLSLVEVVPSKHAIAFAKWITTLEEIVDKYVEMNIAHPFMEGNGRSTRIWLDLMLKRSLKCCVDWSKIDKSAYMEAMRLSVADSKRLRELINGALTDKINDREIFMKGIDYSYYY